MISVRKVIFPGLFAGCVFLVFVTSMIANPKVALAFDFPEPTPTAVAAQEEVTDPGAVASSNAAGMNAADSSDADQIVEVNANSEEPLPPEPAPPPEAGECTIGQAYPDSIRQWCDLIERYSRQHNLDPNLVSAVMLQESGGNPQAYSKSGAVGLMQVMPRDGKASGFMCINGPCFSSRPSMEELYDPEFNVSYGTRMLAGLIQKTGSVRDALRSYGPMNMGYRYADIILSILDRYR